jgi:hypothetical protein
MITGPEAQFWDAATTNSPCAAGIIAQAQGCRDLHLSLSLPSQSSTPKVE